MLPRGQGDRPDRGRENRSLTPARSLAVDRTFIPLGAPIWVDADEQFVPSKRVHRLVIAQDTGGAIKGPVRGDLFWGTGRAAGDRAGEMDARGRYYLLLPRSLAVRLSAEDLVADSWRIDLPRMQCVLSGACDRE